MNYKIKSRIKNKKIALAQKKDLSTAQKSCKLLVGKTRIHKAFNAKVNHGKRSAILIKNANKSLLLVSKRHLRGKYPLCKHIGQAIPSIKLGFVGHFLKIIENTTPPTQRNIRSLPIGIIPPILPYSKAHLLSKKLCHPSFRILATKKLLVNKLNAYGKNTPANIKRNTFKKHIREFNLQLNKAINFTCS